MSRGLVVWVTGLPSAGKSTFAANLRPLLLERGIAALILDGDALRGALVPSPGYTSEERANFYETLARVAALIAEQGLVAIVAATAHRRAFRARARELAPAFIEVWLDVPEERCRQRDSKGLYARERGGSLHHVPGGDLAYEAPEHAEIVAQGGSDAGALRDAAETIVRLAGS